MRTALLLLPILIAVPAASAVADDRFVPGDINQETIERLKRFMAAPRPGEPSPPPPSETTVCGNTSYAFPDGRVRHCLKCCDGPQCNTVCD